MVCAAGAEDTSAHMRLVVLPGVFAPISDSRLLAAHLCAELRPGDRRVLDVFTGSGLLALTAARAGARHVTAIDVSRRAVAGVRAQRPAQRCSRAALRGDLLAPVAGERFDADRRQPALCARRPTIGAGARAPPVRGTPARTAARCSTACSPRRPRCCAPAGGCSSCIRRCAASSGRSRRCAPAGSGRT